MTNEPTTPKEFDMNNPRWNRGKNNPTSLSLPCFRGGLGWGKNEPIINEPMSQTEIKQNNPSFNGLSLIL